MGICSGFLISFWGGPGTAWCLNRVGAFVAAVLSSSALLPFCLVYSARGLSHIFFLIPTVIIQKQHSHASCMKRLLFSSVLSAPAFPWVQLPLCKLCALCSRCPLPVCVCTVHSTAGPAFRRGFWRCCDVHKGTLSCRVIRIDHTN